MSQSVLVVRSVRVCVCLWARVCHVCAWHKPSTHANYACASIQTHLPHTLCVRADAYTLCIWLPLSIYACHICPSRCCCCCSCCWCIYNNPVSCGSRHELFRHAWFDRIGCLHDLCLNVSFFVVCSIVLCRHPIACSSCMCSCHRSLAAMKGMCVSWLDSG